MDKEPESKPRLCVDCRWYEGRCCKRNEVISPVDGLPERILCLHLRMKGGDCGPEALLFEPREDAGKEPF